MKAEIESNLEREEVVQGQTTAHQPQDGDEAKQAKKAPVRKVVDIGRNAPLLSISAFMTNFATSSSMDSIMCSNIAKPSIWYSRSGFVCA